MQLAYPRKSLHIILVSFSEAACHHDIGIVTETFDFEVLDGVVRSSCSVRGARSLRSMSPRVELEPLM